VDTYSRVVRRFADHFDRCHDRLPAEDLKVSLDDLLKTHSWSTIKLDRNGLQLFYKHVFEKKRECVGIIKPPVTRKLADILTQEAFELIIINT
jgi:integrase/recombinase XerD